MAEVPQEMTEEDKAKELENKIRAPLIWAVDRRGVRIEDLQEKRFDEALAIIKEHYLTSEITLKMVNFIEDEESVEDFLLTAKNQMKDKMSLVAVKEATEDIVGVLIQRIVDKATYTRTFSRYRVLRGDKFKEVMRYFKRLEGHNNPHELYNTDRYVKIFTMVFLPKYREKGLEKLMLKSAMKDARSCKVTAIIGVFTTGILQQFAQEVGFIPINTIFYEKYIDELTNARVFYNPGSQNFGAIMMGRTIPDEDEEES